MKKTYLLFFSVMIGATVALWSCKDDEDEKTVTNEDAIAIAKNDAVSDAAYNDIYSESEEILSGLEAGNYSTASSKSASTNGTRTITITKNGGNVTAFPKEITVVYSNFTSNGVKKNGTIKITQSAKIRNTGAVRTVSLENFTLNDTIQLEGKKTITNLTAVNNKPSIEDKLENGKVSFASGKYITCSFTRTITWEDGYSTPFFIFDDVYTYAAATQGSNDKGFSYASATTVPLKYKVGDFCIKEGKIGISIEGLKTVTIDFTRTDCVSKVKLIIDGTTISFDIW